MKVVLKGKDNSVAIMTVVAGEVDEAVKKFQESHPGFYTKHSVYKDEVPVPSSREFRDAWILDNKRGIVVDNNKALNIHVDRIRKARNEKLKELDVETLKNLSDPSKLAEIEEQKQVLRDLPKKVKDLKWPDEL